MNANVLKLLNSRVKGGVKKKRRRFLVCVVDAAKSQRKKRNIAIVTSHRPRVTQR